MNIISKGGVRVPKRYVPKHLSKKDKKKQAKELKKSRRAYKRGKYYQRKKVKSFKRKESSHIKKAKKMYKVKSLKINKSLARKTGCKTRGLRKIVSKGKGAYYSSGSRPNQTAHSWGYARLGSSITGGKASAVDYNILKKYCSKKSKALKLASKMKGKGTRRVKKVKIGGGKKYKKCLGKKNGIDGCRKCCNKKYTRRSYKKCVKKCMKHKPRKWSRKYKKSINCKKPKGFSQRQYCKYGRKN